MTRSENIVSRWSRMKQESARPIVPDGSSTEPKPIDPEPGQSNGATVATSTTGSPVSPAFDPASLPSLQSITVGTDIRSFLASNVPLELTRAALRRTWVTDPAIREFITYFYKQVFSTYCQGERGVLRSRLNRFKDGCEAYYVHLRTMQRIQEQEAEKEPIA